MTTFELGLVGHADGSESSAAELSLQRVREVRDALIREGVPAGAITTVGRGAEHCWFPPLQEYESCRIGRVEMTLQPKRP